MYSMIMAASWVGGRGGSRAAARALRRAGIPLLAAEQLVCVVRRGHPASRRPLTAARYAACEHLMISPHGEDHSIIDRELAARGLRRRVTLTVSHFLVAPFILSGSDLLLTVSARVAETLGRKLDLVVRPCPLEIRGYTLTLVWAERSENDEGHRWLRAAIERAVACEPVAGRGEAGRLPARER
ncbi:LysR substrate-binding domain-containing protein [Sorangium sp. So ce134]